MGNGLCCCLKKEPAFEYYTTSLRSINKNYPPTPYYYRFSTGTLPKFKDTQTSAVIHSLSKHSVSLSEIPKHRTQSESQTDIHNSQTPLQKEENKENITKIKEDRKRIKEGKATGDASKHENGSDKDKEDISDSSSTISKLI